MTRFTHVVFDLDGTLLDTEDLYSEATQRAVAPYGAIFTVELKREIMGGDTMDGARHVVRALNLPIDAETYLAARERELKKLWPSLKPMPGAVRLVDALTARNIPIALATSGHRDVTLEKLAYAPFLSAAQVIVCGDDPRLEHPKPAPDIFLLAAACLGADPEGCAAFEDSVNGVLAAVAAGMHTVALVDPRWGFDPNAFKPAALIVRSLEEVNVDELLVR